MDDYLKGYNKYYEEPEFRLEVLSNEAFKNWDGTWSVYEGDHLLKSGFKTAEEALEWANNTTLK